MKTKSEGSEKITPSHLAEAAVYLSTLGRLAVVHEVVVNRLGDHWQPLFKPPTGGDPGDRSKTETPKNHGRRIRNSLDRSRGGPNTNRYRPVGKQNRSRMNRDMEEKRHLPQRAVG